ncbi:MAG: hypothetical protein AVDCRST_MAG95-201 [uncultured Adhaeribacter sp.]|uniref:Uncharacterized protein n=1 Tax=uncultured Adhaeribacter sp. TaxID=448109 RepID=A0A6J4H4W1_9BACT|nr:MAG: hypothetical protein AVDCRST_MAG95-201 [uncultured Adhaeribacter sp.]
MEKYYSFTLATSTLPSLPVALVVASPLYRPACRLNFPVRA